MSTVFLGTQGGGAGAAPFYRGETNQPAQRLTSPMDSYRLRRYEEHWRFFNGQQWTFERENGEALVTANYCRTVVNKKVSWLIGKGMIIDVPKAMRAQTKPVLEEVWRQNDGDKMLNEIATTGGVTGDVCLLPAYQAPTAAELRRNPYAEGKTRIRCIPPARCFPEWDPLNHERLTALRIVTEVPQFKFSQPDPRRTNAQLGVMTTKRYIETITDTQITTGWEGEGPDRPSTPNALGEIPFVHIANEVFPGEYWGKSDLDDIITLQKELNEKLTDVSDIINYHAAPITIMTGAKAKDLEKGPKALWSGLPEGAKVYNLQLGGDLGVSFKYVEFIRGCILDISNVPEGSFGRTQAISNTSGAALQVQFQPLVEATARKAANYTAGLQKLNYFILLIDQLVKKKQYPIDLCKKCGGRIVRFKQVLQDGREVVKQKCYMVDPQTLDFMKPEDVKVSVTIQHSFGNEVRKMPFGRVKELWDKKHSSYWDPEPMIDLEKEAEMNKQKQELQQSKAVEQQGQLADDEHQRNLETIAAKAPPPKPPTSGAE